MTVRALPYSAKKLILNLVKAADHPISASTLVRIGALFELEAKRQGEDWTKAQEAEYGFIVPERFDETIYFRLLITSGFVLLIYLIFFS